MKIKLILYTLIIIVALMFHSGCSNDDDNLRDSDNDYKYSDAESTLTKKTVTLFFPSVEDGMLHPEQRRIFNTESVSDQAKQAITALIGGSRTSLARIIPQTTRLRELYMDDSGTAYLDMSAELISGMSGGTDNEMLLVYSIVNTLTENFPSIQRIRFLIDGREIQTLSGHLDLTIPFRNRPDLIWVPSENPDEEAVDGETKTDNSRDSDETEESVAGFDADGNPV